MFWYIFIERRTLKSIRELWCSSEAKVSSLNYWAEVNYCGLRLPPILRALYWRSFLHCAWPGVLYALLSSRVVDVLMPLWGWKFYCKCLLCSRARAGNHGAIGSGLSTPFGFWEASILGLQFLTRLGFCLVDFIHTL